MIYIYKYIYIYIYIYIYEAPYPPNSRLNSTVPKGSKVNIIAWLKFELAYYDDFVGFYGISTIVGYLMPNALNIYILNI